MVGITQLAVIHWRAFRGRCGTKSAQSSLPLPHPPKLTLPPTPPTHTHTLEPQLCVKVHLLSQPPRLEIFNVRLDPMAKALAEKENQKKKRSVRK